MPKHYDQLIVDSENWRTADECPYLSNDTTVLSGRHASNTFGDVDKSLIFQIPRILAGARLIASGIVAGHWGEEMLVRLQLEFIIVEEVSPIHEE